VIGAYGGEPLMVEYPNGDRVAYTTVAYECRLLGEPAPDLDELLELGWFAPDAIERLPRRAWIDRLIADALALG